MSNLVTVKRQQRMDNFTRNIDFSKTEWCVQCGDDFMALHNPVFKFENNHPYKLDKLFVVFCDSGAATGSVNLKEYTIRRNGMLVILPGHLIESIAVSKDFKGSSLVMSNNFLAGLDIGDGFRFYQDVDGNPHIQLDEQSGGAIRTYIQMCRNMMLIQDNPNVLESLRLLTKVMFLMLGWQLHKNALENGRGDRKSEIMKNFLGLVKDHHNDRRDVAYYADRMHLSPKYMSTIVKDVSGKGALEWIGDYVILDAKARLSSTTDTIQQICYDLHFPTQSFFGRYFKRIVGMSPSDYRRSVRLTAQTGKP